MSETLTAVESKSLASCERVIEKGLKTCFEVGEALAQIRNSRLYRESHGTFEAYCKDRWGWSKTHANRLIDASEVGRDLTPIGVTPTTESQARPLSKVPKEERAEVWQHAVDTAPRNDKDEPVITARHVEKAVEGFYETPVAEVIDRKTRSKTENKLISTDKKEAYALFDKLLDKLEDLRIGNRCAKAMNLIITEIQNAD